MLVWLWFFWLQMLCVLFTFHFWDFLSTNVPRVWLPQVLSLFSLSENAFFFSLSHSFVCLPNFCQLILNISKCCKMCHVMFSNMYQSMSCIKWSLFIIKLNSKSLQLFCGIWFSVLSLCNYTVFTLNASISIRQIRKKQSANHVFWEYFIYFIYQSKVWNN